MDIKQYSIQHIWVFIVIFSRVGSLFSSLPALGDSFVSIRLRITFAFIISLSLIPILKSGIPAFSHKISTIYFILLQEIFIGIVFGYIVRILLAATSLAGNILAMQSSFSSAMMFDPTQGEQSAIIGNFYSLSAITLMFIMDIHFIMIEGIIESYHFLNSSNSLLFSDTGSLILHLMSKSFLIGIQISSPYLLTGILINIVSAVISRVIPNMQVFFILTPLQILICLVILYITFLTSLNWYIEEFIETLKNLLNFH